MNKVRSLFQSKEGISQTIGVMFLVIAVALLITCIIGVLGAAHEISVMDNYAVEMTKKIGEVGKCSDTEIDKKYNDLKAATGLSPTMTISAPDGYFNSICKTVQYGDQIIVKLEMNIKMLGFSDYNITFPFSIEKSTQSEQYWK
ncbi:DUF4320 family protein [Paludicola sp. MB14-C6]|uniref:DUF4320 family protein n=1 Tax=Paludihabitans sp. MB14-C6 TaxID=3070656 RepID=UPI0027DACFE1|nr:DUF4320 family protein [Paludicola sp. MB14-C6]WMJ24323.1 DUF4320 family protein [Paludicola sp. MB14-C6]